MKLKKCMVAKCEFRNVLASVFVSLAISGCGSSSKGGAQPEVAVDDSRPIGTLVTGTLDDELAPKQLSFTIAEDTVLDGVLAASGQNPATGFTIKTLPQSGELTLRSEGTVFHYEPEANYSGVDGFIYATGDGNEISVSISVTPVPDAPVLDADILRVANQGKIYTVTLQASDADGDRLRFSAENLPDWLLLDPATGVLSGVPRQSDVGPTAMMALTVSDGTGLSDAIDDFQIEVIDINDAPSLNITQVPRKLYGGEQVTFSVFPDDRDNDGVVVSVEPDAAFDATVELGVITLQMRDINVARSGEVTIVGRDDRGAVSREVVPVNLYPRTVSGKGTTVSGVKEGRGVHIVILGDGYAADQKNAFERHVDDVIDFIRADEGIADHLGAFNIHMVHTVSRQSGADDSDIRDLVDTAFDSAYNCQSIQRLICANTLKIYQAALAEYANADQFILLVNDIRYGGSGSSGGRVAITSAFHPEIALHEMGHSLANLADEYVDTLIVETAGAPLFVEGEFKNVSLLSDPSAVPWAHWIDPTIPLPQAATDSGVGVFEGGLYRATGVYRGTANSRMREYDQSFGPVNTEQWILRLYTLTDGYRSLTPAVGPLQAKSGQRLEFAVEPIFGSDIQKMVWTLNGDELTPLIAGVPLASNRQGKEERPKVIQLQGGGAIEALANVDYSAIDLALPPGPHELKMTLSDISGRIRVSPPHVGIVEKMWRIDVQ